MKVDKKEVEKYALQNAVFHSGSAESGPVIGKMLSVHPELKSDVPKLRKEIESVLSEINKLSPEKQKKMLEEIDPSLLEKTHKKQEGLSELPGAREGGVVTRFAPSPTGPLSLGQFLRAVMLSYYYAKKYKGKFILRIEDTDADKIKKEYMNWLQEDLKKCGIEWDQLVFQSDRMDIYYQYAESLLKSGKAYVCECPAEDFKKFKMKKFECPCRNISVGERLARWKRMLEGGYEEGEAVVRLRASMSDPNPVLRDPPILRINKNEHPLKGNKYCVWPLYNLSCAIDDHFLGVTHVFRGKEHEHNTAVQKIIYDTFTWKMPVVINFGMIRFPEGKIHTRDVKKMIETGEISGWDDPKLPTIRALLRRGFRPDALRQCAISCGLSKNDIQLSWENLDGYNRKVIDPEANRYMVVVNPVKIQITGAPTIDRVFEDLHPDFPQRGKKDVPVKMDSVYISKDDFEKLKGKEIRLIGLFNMTLGKESEYTGNEIIREMQKIQWVSEPCVRVKIVKATGHLAGFGEKAMGLLKINDMIQMERIGFARIDDRKVDKITVYFAHK